MSEKWRIQQLQDITADALQAAGCNTANSGRVNLLHSILYLLDRYLKELASASVPFVSVGRPSGRKNEPNLCSFAKTFQSSCAAWPSYGLA